MELEKKEWPFQKWTTRKEENVSKINRSIEERECPLPRQEKQEADKVHVQRQVEGMLKST